MTGEEMKAVKEENRLLRKLHDDATDYTIGELLDNQAWIMLSHVASRLDFGGPDLMEEWQDAWASGEVQEGYWSPNRGASAWIAAKVNEAITAAVQAERERCAGIARTTCAIYTNDGLYAPTAVGNRIADAIERED